MQEKLRKKKEEEEEKARKKREREEKQLTKEKEKRKVEEREAKKAEREAKKAEQENKGKTKAAMKPSAFRGLHGKRKLPGEFSGVVKTYPKRQRVYKTVHMKTSQDTCCVCLGLYRDDIDEGTGNVLPEHDWIQCSEDDCGAWSHVKCLEDSAEGFVCSIYQNVLV